MSQAFDMIQVLEVFIAANVSVVLESLPGAGKTAKINEVFRNGYLDTMVAATRDQTDFGGIPFPSVDGLSYDLRPEGGWVRLNEAAKSGVLTGLFLDEFNLAGRGVAAASLKVVDELIVGGYRLDPSIRRILAINPAEANGGVDLTPAMANRLGHIPFYFPLEDWARMLPDNFSAATARPPFTLPTEAEIEVGFRKYREYVARFARSNTEYIDLYPDDPAERSKAFPTRRTWYLGCRVMGTADALGYDDMIREQSLTAMVGANAATKFADWVDRQVVIDVTEAFNNPTTFVLPVGDDDKMFAVLERVGEEAIKRSTPEAIEAACEVFVRLHGDGRPGVAAAAMRDVSMHVMENKATLLTPAVKMALQVYKPLIAQLRGV